MRQFDIATRQIMDKGFMEMGFTSDTTALPDGKSWLAFFPDGSIRVKDMESGAERSVQSGLNFAIHPLAVSSDSRTERVVSTQAVNNDSMRCWSRRLGEVPLTNFMANA